MLSCHTEDVEIAVGAGDNKQINGRHIDTNTDQSTLCDEF